jgi:hypothetical protein
METKQLSQDFLNAVAKFNYFTADNIPAHVLADKYFSEKYKTSDLAEIINRRGQFAIPSELETIEGIEVAKFANIREQKNSFSNEIELYYIDYSLIFIYFQKTKEVFQLSGFKGKYYLYAGNELIHETCGNLSYNQKEVFTKELDEPNQIGKFTFKKLDQWRVYCNEYLEALKKAKQHYDLTENESQNKIDEFVKALGYKAQVSQYQNKTMVNTKNFRVVFEISSNKRLYHTIQYTGDLESVLEFEK